jgi:hypothetical protein
MKTKNCIVELCFAILSAFSIALLTANSAAAQAHWTAGENSTVQIETNVPSGVLLSFNAEFRKSYCCSVFHSVGLTATSITGSTGMVERTNATPPMASSTGRFCLIQETHSTAGITLLGLSPASSNKDLDMKCAETTLYGGFNTSANDFNFLELTNITSIAVNVKIYVIDFAGNILIEGAPYTLSSDQRRDIDLHTAAGTGNFGLVKILHDGPIGSIVANTSYYKGTAADFTLTDTVPARVRDRLN